MDGQSEATVVVRQQDLFDLFDRYMWEMAGGICSFNPAWNPEDHSDETELLRRIYALIASLVPEHCEGMNT